MRPFRSECQAETFLKLASGAQKEGFILNGAGYGLVFKARKVAHIGICTAFPQHGRRVHKQAGWDKTFFPRPLTYNHF